MRTTHLNETDDRGARMPGSYKPRNTQHGILREELHSRCARAVSDALVAFTSASTLPFHPHDHRGMGNNDPVGVHAGRAEPRICPSAVGEGCVPSVDTDDNAGTSQPPPTARSRSGRCCERNHRAYPSRRSTWRLVPGRI